MTAADPLGALRAFLLADAGVVALVADRVRCLALRDSDEEAMPAAAIVLKPAGGPGSPGGGYQQFGKTRVDVTCYGRTLDESYDLYLTVMPLLKQLQRVKAQNVLLHSAELESKGSTALHPVTQWPTTYSSWLVTAAEIAAA